MEVASAVVFGIVAVIVVVIVILLVESPMVMSIKQVRCGGRTYSFRRIQYNPGFCTLQLAFLDVTFGLVFHE